MIRVHHHMYLVYILLHQHVKILSCTFALNTLGFSVAESTTQTMIQLVSPGISIRLLCSPFCTSLRDKVGR